MNLFRQVPKSLLPRRLGRAPRFYPSPPPTFLLPTRQSSTSTSDPPTLTSPTTATTAATSTYKTTERRSKKPHLHTVIARDPKLNGARLTNTKRTELLLNGMPCAFDNIFLRDACSCAYCVDPSTQQKLFQTSDIPADIRPLSAMTLEDGAVRITWDPETDLPVTNPRRENHTSLYSAEFLLRYSKQRHIVRYRFNDRKMVLWDREVMGNDILWLDYEEYISPLNDEVGLYKALQALSTYGLFFLKNVPSTPSSVETIASRIGPLKSTFYGSTWNLRSQPSSKNIAYTSLNLPLHVDLQYFSMPPAIQFLHSLKNTTSGGHTYFADGFRAATAIRMTSSSLWHSLLTYPVSFHYDNDGHHYHHIHPTVVLDENDYREHKRIKYINYSPPFQAPFEDWPGDPQFSGRFRLFHRAMEMFAHSIEDPEAHFEVRLEEGMCAVFANRRVLHARREFDQDSGERWFRGTYVDEDAFLSRIRVLGRRFKGKGYEREEAGDYGYVEGV
ncbi:Clavaminate synthase-like protein [Choiromyces venosus 120613-1]|uniref:Clavaminate synthase-like protein n=1 Tax=Choiromyces venosus 120613-1 TaxID=1336337 RepID=A0A3N4K8U4_9PEZI|nr:Clavaminate synthase-like protein [Choiromyces venosus 120613-1]